MSDETKKKFIAGLSLTSKVSSLIATASTIITAAPVQHPIITYAGYSGAAVSFLTKMIEEILRHNCEDNERRYSKSTINAANRLFLLGYFFIDVLPAYGVVDKDMNLFPYKLSLAGLWFLTVILDFVIKDPSPNGAESNPISIELHTFSPSSRYR